MNVQRIQGIFRNRILNPLIEEVAGNWFAPQISRGFFRRSPAPKKESVRKILIWNLDSLGDALMTSGFVFNVTRSFPQAEVTLVCQKGVHEIFNGFPKNFRILPVTAQDWYSAKGFLLCPETLKEMNPDISFVVGMGSRPSDGGRIVSRRIGSKYLASTNLGVLKDLADLNLPPNVGPERIWWPEHFQKLLDPFTPEFFDARIVLLLAEEETAEAKKWVDQQVGSRGFVVLHTQVADYALLSKKWPDEYFLNLALKLSENKNRTLVLTGSASERASCEKLKLAIEKKQNAGKVINSAGDFSIREFGAILHEAELVVTGDTSAFHMAQAVGVRALAVFGATDPVVLSPPDDPKVGVLYADLPCRPCHTYRDKAPYWPKCIYSSPRCMEMVTVDQVLQKIQTLEAAP